MNIDFNLLKNSVGRPLKFSINYLVNNKSFEDVFYASILEVNTDHLIVEQILILSDENYTETIRKQKRKLSKGSFQIDTKATPLSH